MNIICKVVAINNPQSNFNLTLSNLIITDEEGKECDIDKVYLHSTEEKRVYESYSLVKNNIQDNNKDQEAIKNSYTAKFNINLNLDKNSNTFKKTVKLIIYSDNLTKEFTTVNYEYWKEWIEDMGYTREDVRSNASINVRIGYELVKGIIDRLQ
ncbi:hypothetical protein [Campylobacter sp. CCUG 57310]|uniref:hypothetical protein n=1 Tax=Campylobacter sp. CCUG 57310 TaxID=2517362 RepID=UPI0015632F67|nr:hypothetical protein [Campylobacter sp. CCUG 57310]